MGIYKKYIYSEIFAHQRRHYKSGIIMVQVIVM